MNASTSSGAHWWVVVGIIGGYLLPTVIALARRHRNTMPVFLVNLFLGWTVAGWFVALVWSCTSNIKEGDGAYRPPMGWAGRGAIVIVVIAGMFGLAGAFDGKKSPAPTPSLAANTPAPATAPALDPRPSPAPVEDRPRPPIVPDPKWSYSESRDQMRGIVNQWAILESENEAAIGGTTRTTRLELQLRDMPKTTGKDAYFHLKGAQFDCDRSGCSFAAKFDDGPIVKYKALRADGRPGDMIFISDMPGFIKRLKASKQLMVEVPMWRTGPTQFVFESWGLKWQ